MAGTVGGSARSGLVLPLGEKERGGDNHILWSPLPGTACAQAGPAARALQNSVESVCFGKVHFAPEPRKTEDSAAGALESRARGDSPRGREEGRAPGRPRSSRGPRLPLVPGPSASSRPSAGTVCTPWAAPSEASSGLRPPPAYCVERFCSRGAVDKMDH